MDDFRDQIDAALDWAKKFQGIVDGIFEEMLSELPKAHIQKKSRVKTRQSLTKKVEKKRAERNDPTYSPRHVTDVLGFRFVCHFQDDVEQLVDAVLRKIAEQQKYQLRAARIYGGTTPHQLDLQGRLRKVFAHNQQHLDQATKKSRYTSVHLDVAYDDKIFEIQVRNVFEDAWAEIEHALKYKIGDSPTPTVDRHLQVLNTFVQACYEYSENILLDSKGDAGQRLARSLPELPLDQNEAELQKASQAAYAKWLQARKLSESKSLAEALNVVSSLANDYSSLMDRPIIRYMVLMERGILCLKLGRYSEALANYNEALALYPERAFIHYRIANVHQSEGRYAEVIASLERVYQYLGSTSNTREELNFIKRYPLMLAHAYWRKSNPEKSIEILQAHVDPQTLHDDIRFANSLAYYELELAKEGKRPVPTERLEYHHGVLKAHNVMGGEYWNALDTFMCLSEQLSLKKDCLQSAVYKKEAKDAAELLESMIQHEKNKDGNLIPFVVNSHTQRLGTSTEDIELVRSHIASVRRVQRYESR